MQDLFFAYGEGGICSGLLHSPITPAPKKGPPDLFLYGAFKSSYLKLKKNRTHTNVHPVFFTEKEGFEPSRRY